MLGLTLPKLNQTAPASRGQERGRLCPRVAEQGHRGLGQLGRILCRKLILAGLGLAVAPLAAGAATTIDPVNKYAYGADLGWINAYADGANGAVIGDYVCMGYLYSANAGWINLGNGSPTNGIRYQNLGASDFGVNHDGLGNLRGYAWGANIGWLNFENNGAPTVNLRTGQLSGYAWSANCGWISLSNAFAFVQTDSLWPGFLAPNGLPISWLTANFGTTNVSASADPDHDGLSNAQEYLAGTNPNDPNSSLRITAFAYSTLPPPNNAMALTWTSVATRFYHVQESLSLGGAWYDSSLGLISPDGATTTRTITDTNSPARFYRVKAVRPLSP